MFAVFNVTGLVTILFLVFLEGLLSLDNALALAAIAKRLPKQDQKTALLFGVWSAFLFRFIALFFIGVAMRLVWVRMIGAGYLILMGLKYFMVPEPITKKELGPFVRAVNFWKTVAVIECVDIAFSIDSVLAGIAVTQTVAIVFIGGCLGILMMRVASTVFMTLMERFPRLETTAYLLVMIIGLKLCVECIESPLIDFHNSSSPAFWVFSMAIVAAVAWGMKRERHAGAIHWVGTL